MDDSKDYNLYSVFLRLCEIKNYSKTADELGYSSHQSVREKMAALAIQLNVKTLFTRTSRGVQPTTEAMELYDKIKPLMKQIGYIEKDMAEFNEQSNVAVRIGIPASLAGAKFKDFFKIFCNKYPNITIEFSDKNSLDLLSRNKIDMVIRFNYFFKNGDFKVIDLFSQELLFAATKEFLEKHNLGREITKEQLCNVPFIIRRDLLEEFESAAGIRIKPRIKTTNNDVTFAMAQNGLGIGCYSDFGRIKYDENLEQVFVKDVKISKTIAVAYNKEHISKGAKAFVDELIKFCKEAKL